MKFVLAKGQPIFRFIPRVVRWGPNISFFWLGKELVYLGNM
jgi:hypothetical protein